MIHTFVLIEEFLLLTHQNTISVTHNQVTGTLRCFRHLGHLRLIVTDLSYCNQIHNSCHMLGSTPHHDSLLSPVAHLAC